MEMQHTNRDGENITHSFFSECVVSPQLNQWRNKKMIHLLKITEYPSETIIPIDELTSEGRNDIIKQAQELIKELEEWNEEELTQ